MSWSDRRRVILGLAALPLAACGFAPAMAPGSQAAALRGAVRLTVPRDRNGFDFAAAIEDRLGRPATPTFALDWTVTATPVGAGITPTGAITRFTLTGRATYRLTEIATGREVTAGAVQSFTSWSTTGSTVATLAAEEDANRRLMRILADQVVTRLIAAVPG